MRVIVTRPAAQAADWVIDLRARGVDAVALPLIDIVPVADPSPIVEAWHALAAYRLAMFVSPNAAQLFFASRPAHASWPAQVLAGSPGPGTTRALLALGVPRAQIVEPAPDAAQFDSESLWQQLRAREWRSAKVLIVRGDGGRDWLSQTLREQGAEVTHLSAYRRAPPRFGAAEQVLLDKAIAESESHVWFFSSSEAIDHLAGLAPAATDWGHARALGTHPRIVARARQLGFASVGASRPSVDAVVACIQSIRP